METLQTASQSQSKVISLSEVSHRKTAITTEPNVSATDRMVDPQTKGPSHRKRTEHFARQGVGLLYFDKSVEMKKKNTPECFLCITKVLLISFQFQL